MDKIIFAAAFMITAGVVYVTCRRLDRSRAVA
jgi:hypothetical protein